MKPDCKKYITIFKEWGYKFCDDKFKHWTREFWECLFCKHQLLILEWLENEDDLLLLMDFVNLVFDQFMIENVKFNEEKWIYDISYIKMWINLIWDLLKKKKVIVSNLKLIEYERPKKIIKEMFGWKWKKTIEVKWLLEKDWYINPCSYKRDDELEKDVEKWKESLLNLYNYVFTKYGENWAKAILNSVIVKKSKCEVD